ncbi:TonB-dependent receptor [Shewanella holmiensis]|jgi:hypothetical protein|uniref:TonB-dependent receptor n=1 Tax=Shewanella holmiensis TaxID=2952222 RepID=A0A9X2WMN2_9GAMM|nr:TonB-dependent receptor [Shewanella holmiensis]MCT7941980.1 TonB-dependent receptor [Shewanella holmiensis]
MTRFYPLGLPAFLGMSVLCISNVASSAEHDTLTPSVALLVDYVSTPEGMWGVTIVPKHFDDDYTQWGYYIGYAKGQKTTLDVPSPSEANMKEYMWRFGLSYSLSQDLSLYSGATAYTFETNYTNNISPRDVDGKPTWERSRDRNWGAEVGLRYDLFKGVVIGAGYDTYTQAAIFSIGFTM